MTRILVSLEERWWILGEFNYVREWPKITVTEKGSRKKCTERLQRTPATSHSELQNCQSWCTVVLAEQAIVISNYVPLVVVPYFTLIQTTWWSSKSKWMLSCYPHEIHLWFCPTNWPPSSFCQQSSLGQYSLWSKHWERLWLQQWSPKGQWRSGDPPQ